MAYDSRLQLEMTPDGQFTAPRRSPISTRILAGAVLVAVVAGGLAIAALALWVALALVPVVIVAVLIAVGTMRFKAWQARRRAGSFGGDRYVARRP